MKNRFFTGMRSVCVAAALLLCGCWPGPQTPEELAVTAETLYRRAIDGYRQRLARGERIDETYYALGRLYYGHGSFEEARAAFAASGARQARKYLAFCYHAMGLHRDALDIFESAALDDDEARYVYGLTAERLNLYDRALQQYRLVSSPPWADKARERVEAIERRQGAGLIGSVDPRLAQLIVGAPGSEQYPEAGALILACDEQIDITGEGTEVSTLRYTVKILNERGKDDFSETLISYDSTFEKVELLYARTIKPDGTVVNVGSRHIRDVSKYLNYPLYSNVRVFIISFPEITEGAVIDYAVKVHNNELVNKKDFVLSYPVQSSEPVLEAHFTVTAPASRAVRLKTLNAQFNTFGAACEPVVQEKDGQSVYRWHFKNIRPIVPEPHMPPDCEVNPTILMSSFGSWEEIYAWWRDLSEDKMTADDSIRQQVAALTAGLGSAEEKARALYEFCAREIRYVAVEYGQAGYEPHFAADIMKNKYGDCKDQAVLLVTMLREAGIEAWPVLISTRDYYDLDREFPSMLFNHCIAAAEAGGRTVFMDPTAETCSFGDLPAADQDRTVLVFAPGNYRIETTPLFPAEHNGAHQQLRLTLHEDESVSGEKTVQTRGIYDQSQRYWLLYTQPELVEQVLQEKVQDLAVGGTLRSHAIENLGNLRQPVVLRYSFAGPAYLHAAGNLRLMPSVASFDASLVAQEERRYPLRFEALDRKTHEFAIALPPGMTVRYLPSSVDEDNQWFSFSARYAREKNLIRCSQVFTLKRTVVRIEEYPAFKRVCERLSQALKQTIVLEKH